jgi:poly(A) polymerase
VAQPPEHHPEGDVWTHTLLMLEGLPTETPRTLAWGVLLHDVGKPITFRPVSVTGDRIRFDGHVDAGVSIAAEICKRLKFSNEDSELIQALVANHMKFKDVGQMRKSTFKRFIRQPHFDEHLELHRLDCLASHRRLDAYHLVRKFLSDTPPDEVRPPRLLTGDDLHEMGYVPGPNYQAILRALEDAQLEGSLSTKAEARDYVRTHYPGGDGGR